MCQLFKTDTNCYNITNHSGDFTIQYQGKSIMQIMQDIINMKEARTTHVILKIALMKEKYHHTCTLRTRGN